MTDSRPHQPEGHQRPRQAADTRAETASGSPPVHAQTTGGAPVAAEAPLRGTGLPRRPTNPENPAARGPTDRGAPWWLSLALAVTAVSVAWAVGALTAAFNSAWSDPIVSVGNRVVDGVPNDVKDAAISVFGTRDKAALMAGTVLILLGLALVTSRMVLRRGPAAALPMVVGLAVLGALSSTLGREGSAFGWVPTLTSAVATMGVFALAARLTQSTSGRRSEGSDRVERRHLLAFAGVTTLAAVGVGTNAGQRRQRALNEERRNRLGLPVAAQALPPLVADPPQAASALYTPNRDFYRIDTALRVPVVDVDEWALSVEGMVDEPLRLSYAELIDRPLFESDITIACVSNEVGGDLVGNARWLGCRLDDLLDEAGIDPQADQIVGWSVDGWSGGFPVEVLDGRDAMIAIGMNGEVLPVEHGFPARLIIPGIYGYVSATKWLDRIELTTFADFAGYWIPRGWARRAPIKVQSRIDRPQGGTSVPSGTYRVGGVAWAPIDGIAMVEVAIDGKWRQATLGPDIGAAAWRQWWTDWDATPGSHVVEVRATNGRGETQTAEVRRPDPDGATGYHRIQVNVEASQQVRSPTG